MTWTNGGGETLEIAVAPADAGRAAFDWRLSIATIARDGPFSAFAGIDRTLVPLDGEGLTLDVAGRARLALAADRPAGAFPGDLATVATLTGGPVTVLNVMTRRGHHTHRVERLTALREVCVASRDTLWLLGAGATVATAVARVTLGAYDVVSLAAGEGARAIPVSGTPVVLVTIRPVG